MTARADERAGCPVNANANFHRTSLLRPNAKAAGYNFGAIGQFVHLEKLKSAQRMAKILKHSGGLIHHALDKSVVIKERVGHSHDNGRI
jgi:hypothetical protein